jgi:hypothetical protein
MSACTVGEVNINHKVTVLDADFHPLPGLMLEPTVKERHHLQFRLLRVESGNHLPRLPLNLKVCGPEFEVTLLSPWLERNGAPSAASQPTDCRRLNMSVHTMETLALFDSAPYQNAFSARVMAVSEQGIALEHTLFYPTGGRQPGDTGYLTLADGSQVEVIGTVRDPLLRSIIWHQVEHCPAELVAGVQVDASLDWERRYQHAENAHLPAPAVLPHRCAGHRLWHQCRQGPPGFRFAGNDPGQGQHHPRPQCADRTGPSGEKPVDAGVGVRHPAADHPHQAVAPR